MPTGYTADVIEKNISFREFALRCCRAFGALIQFRDDDSGKIITEIPLESYHKKALASAERELSTFTALKKSEKVKKAIEALIQRHKREHESYAEAKEHNARLDRMIKKVQAWTPPTTDHARYKEFMLKQLKISLNDLKYYTRDTPRKPTKKLIAQWIEDHESQLKRNVEYHARQYNEDVERNRQNNAWLKAVVNSLPAD